MPNGADWRRPISLRLQTPKPIREVHLTLNQLRYSARFKVELETANGWKGIADRQVSAQTSARRFVFGFEVTTASQVRFTLIESDRPLRICEVRVYE